ncbi:hypothetical protein CJF30_00001298 [Rutstroemia sp. NJR-2017a BBW]|nr:hypothetical protein CJF30_00001298 [Rutstroemia sp. NJR-2017a BBW]
MGLGKTLSVLALVCSTLDILDKEKLERSDSLQQTTLIIAPKSSWQTQISRHIHPGKIRFLVYHGSGREKLATQFQNYDIVITTYESFRSDWAAGGALHSGRWLRVILDEAHHIRNQSSQIFKAAVEIQSRYRWCLTGTPIHNSIDDYGALLSFIGIEPFHEKSSFDYWIVSSLKENRPGSLQLLRNLVRATCLRRTKASQAVCLNLEKCIEKTEEVHLHQEDQLLYDFFKKKTADIAAGVHRLDKNKSRRKSTKDENILSLMNFLRAICNHGPDLLPSSALAAWENSDTSKVDWKMMQASGTTCNQCGQEYIAKRSGSMPRSPNGAYNADVCEDCAILRDEDSTHTRSSSEGASALATAGTSKSSKSAAEFVRPSAKVSRLLENLQQEQRGNFLDGARKRYAIPRIRSFTLFYCSNETKSVIFSRSTKMLDLIERGLNFHGFGFQRIDGQTTLENRGDALRQFNDVPECTVMLASIGSCGEGIDFTAANHVHLIEPQWNPMVEAQAVDRVHRKGQTRTVTVTRYIVPKSIETYIQWVQTQKLKLINQSLDDFDAVDKESLEMERWKVNDFES